MSRPRRRLAVGGALLVGASGLSTGCLPDQVDGRQERVDVRPALDLTWAEETSALDVLDAGLVAMAEVGSVRLRQEAENPGDGDPVVGKDLLLATGEGIGDAVDGDCTGTLQLPSWSEPAELVVQDDLGAFRGGDDFWLGFGGVDPAVREQLASTYADEWTTVPGLATLCELADFLAPVVAAARDDDAVKAGLGDVDGVPAVRVVSRSKPMTVITWVRVAEPHLLLRVDEERRGEDVDGVDRTVTTFSDVDAAVVVDFPAPEDVVAFELPSAPSSGTDTVSDAAPPVTDQ
jgi:hypothetical protein